MSLDATLPPLHSRRVQAWVYSVINPLIDSLRRELFFLEKGNLSWHFYSKKCEYVRPMREYVESSQWPNYEDFLADPANQGFAETFDQHDRFLSQIEAAATSFFNGLIQSDLFNRQVRESLEQYESSFRSDPRYPSLDSMAQDLPKYVAEYLINRTELLPNHYLTHAFWAGYKGQFERLHEEFQPYHQRQPYRQLQQSIESMRTLSERILSWVQDHRYSLCTKYDVPFAPIDVEKTHGVDAFISRNQ
jgi:hypothetical protein